MKIGVLRIFSADFQREFSATGLELAWAEVMGT